MTKVPFKWDTVDSSGKVGINLDKTAAFTSDSAALTVDGDVAASNITSMASDISAQASQISGLGTRISAVESVLPSGTVKATSSMVIESGEVSGLEDNTGRFYSDGLAIKKIHSVWFGAREAGPSIEIGAGPSSGPIYLRRYNSSNNIEKQATLFDTNGDASFPGVVAAATFSGALNGNAATASSAAQASNANTVASLAVSSGRNNVANQIMRTNSSGIAQFGKIDTLATDLSTTPINKIYCGDDNEIKFKDKTNFIADLGLSDALKESSFFGYELKLLEANIGTLAVTNGWGSLYDKTVDIDISSLGFTSVVAVWPTCYTAWELYTGVMSVDIANQKVRISFVRGTSATINNVTVYLLILGSTASVGD